MLSDEEKEVDIESDDDLIDNSPSGSGGGGSSHDAPAQFQTQAEKRAHHNALERKRRDHIKDSFTGLRDSVPSLHGEKSSRAQILKKAADYIQYMRRKNISHQQDIDDLKRQNMLLEAQIRSLEKAKATGNFATAVNDVLRAKSHDSPSSPLPYDQGSPTDSSDSDLEPKDSKQRKLY